MSSEEEEACMRAPIEMLIFALDDQRMTSFMV
jgi:hypothetical protein